MRTRLAGFAFCTAAALSTVLAHPHWPFLKDGVQHNYSQYMTWGGRTGWIGFAFDHTDTDDRTNNYRGTWCVTGDRVGSGPSKGWASCINLHQ